MLDTLHKLRINIEHEIEICHYEIVKLKKLKEVQTIIIDLLEIDYKLVMVWYIELFKQITYKKNN